MTRRNELAESPTAPHVALAGMPKAGKSALAKLLRAHSFNVVSMSSLLHGLIDPAAAQPQWRSLNDLALVLRATDGPDAIARRALAALDTTFPRTCFDGVRSLAEVACLRRALGNVRLVFIHSSPTARYARLLDEDGPIVSQSEFTAIDMHNIGLGVGEVAAMADFVVVDHPGHHPERQLEEILCALDE